MAGSKYNVRIDFYSDWIAFLKQYLITSGFAVDDMAGTQEISIKYFNLQKRLVPSHPRKVLVAKEFTCPQDLEGALKIVRKKIEEGQDLTPHLSKKIANLDYNDALLNDWGIHHLHLGTTTDSIGFVTRTKSVLFVRFDFDNAYFINVMPHGKWSDQELVKVIHRNWPESIEAFRMKGVLGVSPKLSNEDIGQLRKAGILGLVEVEEGVVYIPIGGGYATSGTSTEVVRTSDYFAYRIQQLEQYVIEHIDEIVANIEALNKKVGGELEFELQLNGEQVLVLEKSTQVLVGLGPL